MNPLHRERLVQIKRGGVPAEVADRVSVEPNEETPPESNVRPIRPNPTHGALSSWSQPAMGPLDEGSPPPRRTGTDT